jgi:hypothetical protein
VSQKLTDGSEVRSASIITALMMEEISTSETSVNFYETAGRNIPTGCHLHACRRENLKSQIEILLKIETYFISLCIQHIKNV